MQRVKVSSLLFIFVLVAFQAVAAPIGRVRLLSISPRKVAESPSDIFDEVSPGLGASAVGTKVYLEAEAVGGATLGGAQWELTTKPGTSTATLSDTTGTQITLRLDVPGLYVFTLTPLDGSMLPTETVQQRIYGGEWVGVGLFDTHNPEAPVYPECATCHTSGSARMAVVPSWRETHHAKSLQSHLNGERGVGMGVSCLPCHTVGYNTTAVNKGFDDIANDIGFDLGTIETLVQDAVDNNHDNFAQLPTQLQEHSSVQCESCHGPGSQHQGFLSQPDHGIGGVNLSPNACAQCHDAPVGFATGQGFYAWSTSTHPVTADLSEGSVATKTSCLRCHTGEGFITAVEGGTPAVIADPHSITCAVCHDPHGSTNEHQLRAAGTLTLDSGAVLSNPGLGGLCARCHQSRITNAESDSLTSSRGSHHGPQADIIAGVNAASFGLQFVGNSAHTTSVQNSCVSCHMATAVSSSSGEPLVGGHTFRMRAEMGTTDQSDDVVNAANACASCHAGLAATYDRTARGDYDGDGTIEGIQTEVRGLFDILRPRILSTMPGTTLNSTNGRIDITDAGFAALTDNQKRAFYNYNMFWVDGSFGIHNTSYIVQVLQRSYYGAFGHTITDDFHNIDLRGPVQASTIPTPTPSPTPVPTPSPTPGPAYSAEIDLMGVSPRQVADDLTGVFDETSSGLYSVGVGEKVYLSAVKKNDSVTGYTWSILSGPTGYAASLSATSGDLVTLRPDKKGVYVVRLFAETATGPAPDPFDQRIYSAEWAGVGVFDSHVTANTHPIAPSCGTRFCHGGSNANPDLNVLNEWLNTNHAKKLQSHLAGERGAEYAVSCLPCHSVGFNEHMQAVNGGFDDIAASLGFDLNQIPVLVAEAANTNVDNFPQLPGGLQNHASIQCESCHGAGSLHPSNLLVADHGIDGKNIDTAQCARCHDSKRPEGLGFYQWSNSTHPVTAELSEGSVAEKDSCRPCHTGEGFVAVHGEGKPIPQLPPEKYHGLTCSSCHDPHSSKEAHQLRVVGDFTIPSGARPFGSGEGGLCFRCHNSRVADAESTALSGSKGVHHGPQADMLLGSTGVSFGLPFAPNSPHEVVVSNSCVTCHMAETPEDEPLVGGHSYSMRDTKGTTDVVDDAINVVNACQQCHVGLNTYDRVAEGDYDGDGIIEGTQSEVAGLLELLRTKMLATMPGTSVNSKGVISITDAGFSQITSDQKRALYNYNYVVKDSSFGVHNTSFAVQLLQRSYYGVFGVSIVVDLPGVYLRGPVQPATSTGEASPPRATVNDWTVF